MRKVLLFFPVSIAFVLLASIFIFLRSSTPVFAARLSAPVTGEDQAHIVVKFAPGENVVRPIIFTAPISGYAALRLTGLEVITHEYAWGFAICSIAGVGCPESDCFCNPNKFWNYKYWDGQAWQGYPVGSSESTLLNGATDGWQWGEFTDADPLPAPLAQSAASALQWLQSKQSLINGGYTNDSGSAEALLAIAANNHNAIDWRIQANSPSLHDYWAGHGARYSARGAAEAGKLAVGLAASDICWPALAMRPTQYFSPTSGAYDPETGFHTWGMLGSLALDQPVDAAASQYLKSMIRPDGGWEWNTGFGSDSNTTSLAIQALIAAGEPLTITEIISGFIFLKSAQNSDGGFTYQPGSPYGTDSDANSTAYAVQAIYAAKQDPMGAAWTVGSANPLVYLLSLQLPNGSFSYQAGGNENLYATTQAIPALLGKAFPFKINDLPACPTVYISFIRN